MSKALQHKVAIVTGGGQGLGAAICERLTAEGCQVIAADIKGTDTKVDVTSEADVKALFDNAVAKFGRVDIVVANAAILIAEPIAEADAEKWLSARACDGAAVICRDEPLAHETV
jgi:NAD(P)-dependent dehydrogenase (short-subunit alcohol dehydrogenase family)